MNRLLARLRRRMHRPTQADLSRIEALETQADIARRDDADQLGQLVAEAECARLGHNRPPGPQADTELAEFVPWGLADPFPRCQRCKVRLTDDTERAASDA